MGSSTTGTSSRPWWPRAEEGIVVEGEEARPAMGRLPPRASGESDYSKGFEDGTKEALREVLSFVARGHSASEVRLLAETRLAHLDEETDHRRSRLLPPPRRIALDTLLQVKVKDGPGSPETSRTPPPPLPGFSYLFQEAVPTLARGFLGQVLAGGMPVVALTRHPQDLLPLTQGHGLLVLTIGGGPDGEREETQTGVQSMEADAGSLTGRLVRFQERSGGQTGCYLDAFEYLVTEWGFERAIRFVHWLNTAVQKSKGVLILSADPDSLDPLQLSSLKKDFSILRH